MSKESMMSSNHLILCRPLLLLPSIFPSLRAFSNELTLHIRWPNYWSCSFCISASNEYSGFIFFRIDWFDLLAFQGTFKSSPAPQSESINASVLSFLNGPTLTSIHPVVTTGKTIALIIWTFANKVMPLLFSHEVKVCHSFFPKKKAFINFMAAVTTHRDFGAFKNKIHHCSHFFPIYLP